MSFFIRKKGGNVNSISSGDRKRKNQISKHNASSKEETGRPPKFKRKTKKQDADNEELDSDFEDDVALNPTTTEYESDEEDANETAQDKRLRVAKVYLKEIEREEKERAETDELDNDVIASRLKGDFLDSTGRLKKRVADNYTHADIEHVTILKCKEHRFSITCLVMSSDNLHIYSGSKDGGIVKWSLTDRRKLKSIPRGKKGSKEANDKHTSSVVCLAISTDNRFLVSGGGGNCIFVWNPESLERVHTFLGHRGAITGLAFRQNTHQLFSASEDRSVKVWSLTEMSYTETLFGHQSGVTSVDALSRERAITSGGRDNTIRIWKVVEESQLIFNGHKGSIDTVRLLSEENFLSAGDDGDLCIWGTMKKRPLAVVNHAHGFQAENQNPNWISSIATLLNTDLVASGSCDGFVRLWKCSVGFRSLEPVMEIPVPGFVNSLSFTSDGHNLIAGIGQEHRLGRWWRLSGVANSIHIIPLLQNTPQPVTKRN